MNSHLTRSVRLLIRILISDDFIRQKTKNVTLYNIWLLQSTGHSFPSQIILWKLYSRDVLIPAPKFPPLMNVIICASFWRSNELIAGVIAAVLKTEFWELWEFNVCCSWGGRQLYLFTPIPYFFNNLGNQQFFSQNFVLQPSRNSRPLFTKTWASPNSALPSL